MNFFLTNPQRQGAMGQSAWLLLAVLAALAVIGPVAAHRGGSHGFWAAAVAAALCLSGATVALLLSHALRGGKLVLYAVLLGMAARLGVPLGLGLALHLCNEPLANSGLLFYLLVFYPVSLIVEIYLSLGTVSRSGHSAP
jgi:hypothetical protein